MMCDVADIMCDVADIMCGVADMMCDVADVMSGEKRGCHLKGMEACDFLNEHSFYVA